MEVTKKINFTFPPKTTSLKYVLVCAKTKFSNEFVIFQIALAMIMSLRIACTKRTKTFKDCTQMSVEK